MSERNYYIHPSSFADEPCRIGVGTKIWHFCHVMADAQIGERCILGQNVFVAGGVRIGDNVKIQNNVSVYAGVELEDDVFCGPSCVFTNVINPRSEIVRRDQYQRTLVRAAARPSAPMRPSSAASPWAAMPLSPPAQLCVATCRTTRS